MEQGFHRIAAEADDDAFFERVVDRLIPLAESRLVIDNEFVPDLPRELWHGDRAHRVDRAGRPAAGRAGPAARPVADRRAAHRRTSCGTSSRLFGIGGLSYGNASARQSTAIDFWMSASGVDKSQLREIGREILLVTGYRRGARRDPAQRPARRESRGASRSTPSST